MTVQTGLAALFLCLTTAGQAGQPARPVRVLVATEAGEIEIEVDTAPCAAVVRQLPRLRGRRPLRRR